jgi:hypothetical protein
MAYQLLADTVLVAHLGFILFVVAGGFLVRWRRSVAWVHLPAAGWGALIEFMGWICPLTPLENWARSRAGETGYAGGFVEHYLIPVVYPAALTRDVQIALGVAVLIVNLSIYTWVFGRRSGGSAD